MNNLNTITTISDIPKFSGNNKVGEKTSITIKNYLRTLTNYFNTNNITEDKRRIDILYSTIDPNKGDAFEIINTYAGTDISYDQLTKELVKLYPTFITTNYRHSVKLISQTNIHQPSVIRGMSTLTTQTRALVEAYLNKPNFAAKGLVLKAPIEGTGEVIIGDDDEIEADTRLTIKNLLENFFLHFITSTQLENKVYEKIEEISPFSSCTEFMARVVEAHELVRVTQEANNKKVTKNEVVFAANNSYSTTHADAKNKPRQSESKGSTNSTNNTYYQNSRSNQSNRYTNVKGGHSDKQRMCYRCGNKSHIIRDCKVSEDVSCKYCRKRGHLVKACKKRLQEAQGKYCGHCKLQNSHNTSECLKKGSINQHTYKNKVRVAETSEQSDYEYDYDESPPDAPDDDEQ